MTKKIHVEIWSDLVCPWCWIGKRRFEQALEVFPHAEDVTVTYRAYRLSPGAAPQPVKQMLGERYRVPPEQVQAMLANVESTAKEVGLEYHLGETWSGDTTKPHQLVQFASTIGQQEKMIERLYRAYFTEKISLFKDENLITLAEEVGLTRQQATSALTSDELAKIVVADENFVRQLGLSGVPFFLLNRKTAVSGAQPAGHFASAIQEAWNDPEGSEVHSE